MAWIESVHCNLEHCSLYTVIVMLSNMYGESLYTVHSTLYTVQCILYTVTLYTVHCTLYTVIVMLTTMYGEGLANCLGKLGPQLATAWSQQIKHPTDDFEQKY